MIRIKIGEQMRSYPHPVRLEDLANEFTGPFYAAKVNNRLRELTYVVNQDATVEFLDFTYQDAARMLCDQHALFGFNGL